MPSYKNQPFDVKSYFKTNERILSTFTSPIELNKLDVLYDWLVVRWRLNVDFGQNKIIVADLFRTDGIGVQHQFAYSYVTPEHDCIFRFDTHGAPIQYGESCHLHIGDKRVIEDENPELNGYSLCGMDFPSFNWLVHRHRKGRTLPWK